MEVNDADGFPALGDDQHHHRGLRRRDALLHDFARKHAGGDRPGIPGHDVLDTGRHQARARTKAGPMSRRKSPSVLMPAISPLSATMQEQPQPFDHNSTSASDIFVPSGLIGMATPACMMSGTNFSIAASLPPGWKLANS